MGTHGHPLVIGAQLAAGNGAALRLHLAHDQGRLQHIGRSILGYSFSLLVREKIRNRLIQVVHLRLQPRLADLNRLKPRASDSPLV